ncbi:hypothetical protein DMH04_53530 [Kibdelosporangium aridum]|uniref:Carrier domain-containing protein n=1 Tax=Kibdelosporangium aridum TaxID=2030 RepID=A0A428Y2X2_KIBAR|nr:thioesterase domain-containing protein [Kibdelosporangium aridum]RSM61930.1 hypothetical protein DMH04_53530 [Kibdelosporangium aridum]
MACAAGMAGLIKTALVLHHQTIPPQANLAEPNPLLQLDSSGFTIYRGAHRPDAGIKAASVTSLGMGGTNAHMILTAAPARPIHRPEPADTAYLLPVSARTSRDLRAMTANLRRHLLTHDVRIDDLAYTLTHGRTRFPVSATVRARTIDEAVVALDHLQQATDQPDHVVARDDFAPAVKIALPGHPLHRKRHWVDAPRQAATQPSRRDAPAGALLDEVVTVFRDHLGIDDLGPDDDFTAAGGSSMTAMEIVDTISQRLGAVISLSRFLKLGTPRRVTGEIRTWPGGNLVDPTIVRLRDGTPGQEIFFIYPVNGTVFCYHKMAPLFTFGKPVYAVSYPFNEPDPPRTVPEMAARCIADIRSVAPHGPYRLAGYSMGGNLAVEMAAQLADEGERVTDIVMIDAVPAEAYPPQPVPVDYRRAACVTMSYFLGLPVPGNLDSLSTVDDVIAVLRRPTWTTRTQQIIRQCVESLVANAMEISVSSPGRPIDADITVLSAAEQSNPAYDVVGIRSLPPESWQRHTTGTITSVVVPGNHYTLYTEHFDDIVGAFNQVYGD